MTREQKQLLLKDLCARLPHELWVEYEGKEWLVTGYGHGRVSLLPSVVSSIGGTCPLVEEVRLYLRPMSSMTEEEENEFISLNAVPSPCQLPNHTRMSWYSNATMLDWLNAHHFDYRGLTSMGLALIAPEGMYETE